MRQRTALAIGAMIAGLLLIPGPAQADPVTRCEGSLGDVVIEGDLVVPPRAECLLRGTVVEGDLIVRFRAELRGRGIDVSGDLRADDPKRVRVSSGRAQGTVKRTVIDGDVRVDGVRAGKLTQTTVGGTVRLTDGRNRAYGVRDNRIRGDLVCRGNRPAPIGGSNKVGGSTVGQCADL